MFFGDGVETSHARLHMKFRGYMYSVLLMSGNFMYVQKKWWERRQKKKVERRNLEEIIMWGGEDRRPSPSAAAPLPLQAFVGLCVTTTFSTALDKENLHHVGFYSNPDQPAEHLRIHSWYCGFAYQKNIHKADKALIKSTKPALEQIAPPSFTIIAYIASLHRSSHLPLTCWPLTVTSHLVLDTSHAYMTLSRD